MSTSVLVWPSMVVVSGDGNVTMMPGASGTIPPEMLPDIAIPKVHKVADAAARSALVSSGALDEGEWIIQLDDDSWWLFDGAALHQAPVITPGVYALVDHTHAIGDVTGLVDALAGKAATAHAHAISDVTGLATALSSKAAVFHGHSATEIAAPTVPNGHVLTATDGVGAWAAPTGGGSLRPAFATYDTEADLPSLIGEAELGEMALLHRTGRVMRWSEMSEGVYAWLEYGRIAPRGPATPATSPMALDLGSATGGWIHLIVLDDDHVNFSISDPIGAMGSGGAEVIFVVINLCTGEGLGTVWFDSSSFWRFYDGTYCYSYRPQVGSVTQLRFRVVGDTVTGGATHAVAIEPEAWVRESVPLGGGGGGGGVKVADYLADLTEATEEGEIAMIPPSGLVAKSRMNSEMMMEWQIVGLFEPAVVPADEGAVTDAEFEPNFAIDEPGPDSGRLYYVVDPAPMAHTAVIVRPPTMITDAADGKCAVILINNLVNPNNVVVDFTDRTDLMGGPVFRWMDPDGQMYGVHPTVAAGFSLVVKFRLSKAQDGSWTARQIEPAYVLASGGGGGGSAILSFLLASFDDIPPYPSVVPTSGAWFYYVGAYDGIATGGIADKDAGTLTPSVESTVVSTFSADVYEPSAVAIANGEGDVHRFDTARGAVLSRLITSAYGAWKFRDDNMAPMSRSAVGGSVCAVTVPSTAKAGLISGVNDSATPTTITDGFATVVHAGIPVTAEVQEGGVTAGDGGLSFPGDAARDYLMGWNAAISPDNTNRTFLGLSISGQPDVGFAARNNAAGVQLFGGVGIMSLGPAGPVDAKIYAYSQGVNGSLTTKSIGMWAVDITDLSRCRLRQYTNFTGATVMFETYFTDFEFDLNLFSGTAFSDTGTPTTDISIQEDGTYVVGYDVAMIGPGDEYRFELALDSFIVPGTGRSCYTPGTDDVSASLFAVVQATAGQTLTLRKKRTSAAGNASVYFAELFAVKIA